MVLNGRSAGTTRTNPVGKTSSCSDLLGVSFSMPTLDFHIKAGVDDTVGKVKMSTIFEENKARTTVS